MSEPEHLGGKRAESARLRRAEQLRRWKGSLTEQEPVAAGGGRGRHRGAGGSRVRFEEGAVFLAACSSGDTEEVKRLLGRGARINTTNVDGLTALHQVPAAAGSGLGGSRARGGPGGSLPFALRRRGVGVGCAGCGVALPSAAQPRSGGGRTDTHTRGFRPVWGGWAEPYPQPRERGVGDPRGGLRALIRPPPPPWSAGAGSAVGGERGSRFQWSSSVYPVLTGILSSLISNIKRWAGGAELRACLGGRFIKFGKAPDFVLGGLLKEQQRQENFLEGEVGFWKIRSVSSASVFVLYRSCLETPQTALWQPLERPASARVSDKRRRFY